MRSLITLILALWIGQAGLSQEIDLSNAYGNNLAADFQELKMALEKEKAVKLQKVYEELKKIEHLFEGKATIPDLIKIFDLLEHIENNQDYYQAGPKFRRFRNEFSELVNKVEKEYPEAFVNYSGDSDFSDMMVDLVIQKGEPVEKNTKKSKAVGVTSELNIYLIPIILVLGILIGFFMPKKKNKASKKQKLKGAPNQGQGTTGSQVQRDNFNYRETTSLSWFKGLFSKVPHILNPGEKRERPQHAEDTEREVDKTGGFGSHEKKISEEMQVNISSTSIGSMYHTGAQGANWQLEKRNQELEKDILKLKERIKELEEDKQNLEDQIKVKDGMTDSLQNLVMKESSTLIRTEFFLSTPNKDGSFNESGKSNVFKPFASMYKFTITDQEGKLAEFEFYSDPSTLPNALNYPDTYLLPVCENTNATNPRARNIKTIDKGKVEFLNGQWRLKDNAKARIRYDE